MREIEIYQSELGEKALKIVLEHWYALKLEQVPKIKNRETPDYKIIDGAGDIIAVCEVKSCVDANVQTYNPTMSREELAEVSKKKDRNHRSKLQRHHSKAMAQLVGYHTLPTLVVFVSFDMTDHIDMDIFLQDHQTLYPSAAMADLYLLLKIHQDIIPSDKFEIRYMIQLRHSTKLGENFGHRHLSLEEALHNGGFLPATFELPNNGI